MIRITRTGTFFSGGERELARLRTEFDRDHHVRLHQLVEPGLLEIIRQQIDRATFYERVHPDIGPNKELCLGEDTPSGLLHVLFNGQRLFETIQQITWCKKIGSFSGRVYRFAPGCGHHDAWHDDIDEHRMVALSLNLSPRPYEGGVLQIRAAGVKTLLQEVANTGFGDALVFRLAPHLEHRVTLVEGHTPKTAFAGWFFSHPSFVSWMRERARPT